MGKGLEKVRTKSYKVKAGDTLWTIAKKYKTTVTKINPRTDFFYC